MPKARDLSPEEIQEILSLRGVEPAASIRKRFGIGTTRLYKIWKQASIHQGNQGNQEAIVNAQAAASNGQGAEKVPTATNASTRDMAAVLSALDNLQAKIDILQAKMGLLQDGQELHLEDLDEVQRGILDHIEEGSNVVREKTENILSAANAARDAAYNLLVFCSVGLAGWALAWVLVGKLSATPKPKAGTREEVPKDDIRKAPKGGILKME